MGGPAGVTYQQGTAVNSPGLTIGSPKVKRVWLASFLSAIAAVVAVTLTGVIVLFINAGLASLMGHENFDAFGMQAENKPVLSGMFISGLAAAANGWVFYIKIPVATLVLGLSIGRFPKRRIVRSVPYFRWGAIWGAVLVLMPSLFGLAITGSFDNGPGDMVVRFISGSLTAAFIGAVSGVAVACLWLAIVRPIGQIKDLDTSVFT